jgi:hypothetical protein
VLPQIICPALSLMHEIYLRQRHTFYLLNPSPLPTYQILIQHNGETIFPANSRKEVAGPQRHHSPPVRDRKQALDSCRRCQGYHGHQTQLLGNVSVFCETSSLSCLSEFILICNQQSTVRNQAEEMGLSQIQPRKQSSVASFDPGQCNLYI